MNDRRDIYGFFLQPVDTSFIMDYSLVVKHPMDLGRDFKTRRSLKSDSLSENG